MGMRDEQEGPLAKAGQALRGAKRMSRAKYKRCKKCKQLVSDPENCGYCANHDPLADPVKVGAYSKRGSPTLDAQEGNAEESF